MGKVPAKAKSTAKPQEKAANSRISDFVLRGMSYECGVKYIKLRVRKLGRNI